MFVCLQHRPESDARRAMEDDDPYRAAVTAHERGRSPSIELVSSAADAMLRLSSSVPLAMSDVSSDGESERRERPGDDLSDESTASSQHLRKQREFIPDFCKDEHYWAKRRKNNAAAKRSREKRRLNDMQMEHKIWQLTTEKDKFRKELEAIKTRFGLPLDKPFPVPVTSNGDMSVSSTDVYGSSSNGSRSMHEIHSMPPVFPGPHPDMKQLHGVSPYYMHQDVMARRSPSPVANTIASVIRSPPVRDPIPNAYLQVKTEINEPPMSSSSSHPVNIRESASPAKLMVDSDAALAAASAEAMVRMQMTRPSTSSVSDSSDSDGGASKYHESSTVRMSGMHDDVPPHAYSIGGSNAWDLTPDRSDDYARSVPLKLRYKLLSSRNADRSTSIEDEALGYSGDYGGDYSGDACGGGVDMVDSTDSHEGSTDVRYMERRRRNNMAARKCRENRKMLNNLRVAKSSILENENSKLKMELHCLTSEFSTLNDLLERKKYAESVGEQFVLPPLDVALKQQDMTPAWSADSSGMAMSMGEKKT